MTKVGVIGGGPAGSEAANEAARLGAEVTLYERSAEPTRSWTSMLDLIWPLPRAQAEVARDLHSGVSILREEVVSVSRDRVASMGGGVRRFDAVVLATGSGAGAIELEGFKKEGVVMLDSQGAYRLLSEKLARANKVVVYGEGKRCVEVADRLSEKGEAVCLVAGPWRGHEPSPEVRDVLHEAAESRGVSVLRGTVTRALGSSHLEAVVAEGGVIATEILVLVPGRRPHTVRVGPNLGTWGGHIVGPSLQTSMPRVYAAGGCAELECGLPLRYTLEGESTMSGRIAGANATGQRLRAGFVRYEELSAFGVRWKRVGLGFTTARACGMAARHIGRRWGPRSACSIVFDHLSGRVIGIETVDILSSVRGERLPSLSPATTLLSLAYGTDYSSSDISLVSETARLGVQSWSKS